MVCKNRLKGGKEGGMGEKGTCSQKGKVYESFRMNRHRSLEEDLRMIIKNSRGGISGNYSVPLVRILGEERRRRGVENGGTTGV